MYFGVQTYYTLKVSHAAFLLKSCKVVLKDTITGCQAKTLILVGGKEQKIMKMSAELLSKKINKSALEILPQYYHGDLSINHSMEYVEKLLRLICV